MRRIVVLTLAAIGLSACGPDDHAVNDSSTANTSVAPQAGDAFTPSKTIEPLVTTTAIDPPASSPAAAAEQSLAADSQQISPVLHYPPDSAN